MNFDGISLRACLCSVRRGAMGARVQRIVQPSPLSLAFSLYTANGSLWLVCSAEAPAACLFLAKSLPGPSIEATPFCTLLRRHLLGARLAAADQVGWDRIATLGFSGRDELGDPVSYPLYVEIMGKHSNIVCVRTDGRILDAVKHVGRSRSRVRQVLPARSYELPPLQSKLAPDELTGDELAGVVAPDAGAGQPAAGPASVSPAELVRVIAGMDKARASVLLSALRAGGQAPLSWEAVALQVRLAAQDAPADAKGEEECRRAEEAFRGFIEAAAVQGDHPLAAAQAAGASSGGPRPGSLRALLEAALSAGSAKAKRRVEELTARLDGIPDPADQLRRGNALLTSLGSVRGQQQAARGKGLAEVELALPLDSSEHAQPSGGTGEAGGAGPLRFRIAADEDPVVAAQRCFELYSDGRRAREAVGSLLQEARDRLEYLEELLFQLEAGPGELTPEIAGAIIDGARRAGITVPGQAERRRPEAPGRAVPGRHSGRPLSLRSPGGMEVLVGRNNLENDRLLRLGAAGDLWFHARGVPGAHVLLRRAGLAEMPEEDVYFAAAVAAGRSRAAGDGTAPVDMVPLRLVRREKGAPPGFVRYSGETTIRVIPRPSAETEPGGAGEPGGVR